MHYIVYKTKNILNGKYYIGVHKTSDLDDGYLGSGQLLKKSIEKYGKSNFIRETLFEAFSYENAFIVEKEILKDHEEYFGNMCYNLNKGGKGSWFYVNSIDRINPMHIEDNQKKLSKKIRYKLENDSNFRSMKSEIAKENLKKAIETNTGSKRPKHSIFMCEYAKQNWENNKEYMRDCLSNWFMLYSPNGDEYKTNRLEDLCRDLNLPYTTIWKSSTTNRHIKKGKAKGWLCRKI